MEIIYAFLLKCEIYYVKVDIKNILVNLHYCQDKCKHILYYDYKYRNVHGWNFIVISTTFLNLNLKIIKIILFLINMSSNEYFNIFH